MRASIRALVGTETLQPAQVRPVQHNTHHHHRPLSGGDLLACIGPVGDSGSSRIAELARLFTQVVVFSSGAGKTKKPNRQHHRRNSIEAMPTPESTARPAVLETGCGTIGTK